MAVVKRRPLSRRRILEAAVRFVDREGLEALSMRKLGSELGVEAMSLYNHIPNKSALLDGMVEVLLGELEVPPEDEGWERRVREAYRAFRRLAHEHPNCFPLLLVRLPDTMDRIWLGEEFFKTLREAGFDPGTALYAFRALSSYAPATRWPRSAALRWSPPAPISAPACSPRTTSRTSTSSTVPCAKSITMRSSSSASTSSSPASSSGSDNAHRV
jgi:AcrR family transcriptional regulator